MNKKLELNKSIQDNPETLMNKGTSRRQLLKAGAAFAAMLPLLGCSSSPDELTDNDTDITTDVSDLDNPDRYTSATSTYVSKDYEQEDADDDMWINGGGSVAVHEWLASGGYNSSGAWKVTPKMSTLPNETNAGWAGGNGTEIPYGDTQVLTISYLIYMSQELANAISSGTAEFWQHGNKIIDVFCWDTSSQDQGDAGTRQVIKCRAENGQVKFSHMVGGAGSEFFSDGSNPNFQFELNANQWIWIAHVFDAKNQVTRTYFKKTGDQGVTKALERFSTDGPESYTYTSAGWTLFRPGGGPASAVWGYWDDIGGISDDPDMFVKLDRLRITNGWTPPPF